MTRRNKDRGVWAFVLTWSPCCVGGVNETIFALAEQVRKRGYHPVIAVVTWDGAPQPATVRGVEVVSLWMREPLSSESPHRWLPGAAKTFFTDTLALLRFVRHRRVAVWNPHFPGFECVVPVWLRRIGLLRVPVVASFHGLEVTEMKKTRGSARRMWRTVLHGADAVIAVSAALRREIAEFDPKTVAIVIQNGVNPATFSKAHERSRAAPVILHIGKFEPKKAQDVLLRAFRQLLDAGTTAKLVLVGASGPTLDGTRSLVAELGLGSHVSIHVDVPHERVPAFLGEATVFALPSRSESFGLVLLEAGAAGVPIVASAVGGIPEVVQDEVTGLLIPPDDVAATTAALRRLLADEALRSRLSQAMRGEVTRRWSWDKSGEKYCDLLERLAV